MPDYEDMILARQEAAEISEDCDGACFGCPLKQDCYRYLDFMDEAEGNFQRQYEVSIENWFDTIGEEGTDAE